MHCDAQFTTDDGFRRAFRDWLEDRYPAAWRQDDIRPFRRLCGDDLRRWIAMLNDGGWRCPGWPVVHGGMGLSFRRQVIYQQELERISAARVIDLGEVQLGPTIIAHGSEEQQRAFLPAIVSGEHLWCQGYSEPNAGSDLASLQTMAVREDGMLRINGQKIWTTFAQDASHIFALVRTARGPRPQQGISFVLVPMDAAGITVRPIRNAAGEAEFCEVFFDDVTVPVANVVGGIDNGWAIAKALLGWERVWIGSPALCRQALHLTRTLLDARPSDLALADVYAELSAGLHDATALYRQSCAAIAEGREPGGEGSISKIVASDLLRKITEFNIELGGEQAGVRGPTEFGDATIDLPWQYHMARPPAIFAGSNEIQRNILAKAMLGLAE